MNQWNNRFNVGKSLADQYNAEEAAAALRQYAANMQNGSGGSSGSGGGSWLDDLFGGSSSGNNYVGSNSWLDDLFGSDTNDPYYWADGPSSTDPWDDWFPATDDMTFDEAFDFLNDDDDDDRYNGPLGPIY